jgi:GDPmannose 4,6-dehydratase
VDRRTGRVIIRVNPKLLRPAEVDALYGNAAKAKAVLDWSPRADFASLVGLMVEADLARVKDGRLLG